MPIVSSFDFLLRLRIINHVTLITTTPRVPPATSQTLPTTPKMIMNRKINVPGGANARNPVVNKTAMRLKLFMSFREQCKRYRSVCVSKYHVVPDART